MANRTDLSHPTPSHMYCAELYSTRPLRDNDNISRCRQTSVSDPNPDPHVFGPPGSGSGSISQRYGFGSGSCTFYH
jgi:hypothetical protein